MDRSVLISRLEGQTTVNIALITAKIAKPQYAPIDEVRTGQHRSPAVPGPPGWRRRQSRPLHGADRHDAGRPEGAGAEDARQLLRDIRALRLAQDQDGDWRRRPGQPEPDVHPPGLSVRAEGAAWQHAAEAAATAATPFPFQDSRRD